jgi:hypothetical protein
VLVFVLVAAVLIVACGDERSDMTPEDQARLATAEQAVTSPSGDYQLDLVEHAATSKRAGSVSVRIRDRTGHTVHDSSRLFSSRFETLALWDDEVDRAWVYSSDVGTYVWDRREDGAWTERPLGPRGIADRKPPPPALLVERHPERFGPDGREKARRLAEQQAATTYAPATPGEGPRPQR